MHNHPYTRAPKKWADYYCAGTNAAEVDYIKRIISQGAKSLPRSLFITGKSGVGKTSLSLLLIRSFRCLTRKDGDYEPCGECEACRDIDVRLSDRSISGVVWVQPGSYTEETLNQSVKNALQAAAKGATNTGDPNRDVLFVVFDEWQEFARNLRQQVLLRTELEVPGNQVCYIFHTMKEEDLAEEDRLALIRRSASGVIRLGMIDVPSITSFLLANYPHLNPEAASILAEGSKGRIGLATALYDACIEKFETVTPEVAAYTAQIARGDWRWSLWELLQNKGNFLSTINYTRQLLEVVSSEQLCKQMQEDILTSAAMDNHISEDQIVALNILTQYEVKLTNFVTYVSQLYGKNLVQRGAVIKYEEHGVIDYVTS